MLEAAIFDLDGLMFDTEPIWVSAWEPAFKEQGLELKPGLVKRFFGMSQSRIEELVAQAYGNDPRAISAVREHVRIGIEEMLANGAPKKPGLDELLALLSDKGVPCAVASASPRTLVEAHLRKGGVEAYFSAVIAGDDGLPSKPHAGDAKVCDARLQLVARRPRPHRQRRAWPIASRPVRQLRSG